jgi:hypothetical protein
MGLELPCRPPGAAEEPGAAVEQRTSITLLPPEEALVNEVRQIPAAELDEDRAESWERLTDEPDVLGVDASLITAGAEPYWSVWVRAAELVRQDPLESQLRHQMAGALAAVDGADNVWEEDREAWGVLGPASGEALVRAASDVLDRLAPSLRLHVAGL